MIGQILSSSELNIKNNCNQFSNGARIRLSNRHKQTLKRGCNLYFYNWNVGDYLSHCSRLSIYADLAYRRILDQYYINEKPIEGTAKDVSLEIGMPEYESEVGYVLNKFFKLSGKKWRSKRADLEIKKYKDRLSNAKAAGKASGKARKNKACERSFNEKATDLVLNKKQELRNKKQELKIKDMSGACAPDQIQIIFNFWIVTMKKSKAAKLTPKRKAKIKARLGEGYSQQDIFDAITGCKNSKYHQGENDTKTTYDDLELICRSGEKLEQFKNNYNSTGLSNEVSKTTKQNIENLRGWENGQ